MKKIVFVIVLFSFFAMPIFCLGQSQNIEKIFYMSELREKEGLLSLQKNADKVDILAPQFYGVSCSLNLTGGLSKDIEKIVKEKKLKVMPLVTNYAFRQDIIHNLLLSKNAQQTIINNLIKEAKEHNYIGWQFDFENINYKYKDLYSAFVEKAAKAMHENNLILSVAAVARSVDYENTASFKNWSGVFDYVRIANAVDFVSLMLYDDPESVGPVASNLFIKETLKYVEDKIPEQKLSLGIPLYYWQWDKCSAKRVVANGTYNGLSYIKSNFKYDSGFDSYLGVAWISFLYQDKQYQIWTQNKESFKEKIGIIEKNNFRGFSAWVLGVEDPEIWPTLNNQNQIFTPASILWALLESLM